MRRHLIGGGLLAGVGGLVLLLTLFSGGGSSPRSWIGQQYAGMKSSKPPTLVAQEISNKYSPIDRANDPTGVFLRYSNDVVAVLPDGTGSRIRMDNPQHAYATWFPILGGRWGGPGGASTFRGGGPGGGGK